MRLIQKLVSLKSLRLLEMGQYLVPSFLIFNYKILNYMTLKKAR